MGFHRINEDLGLLHHARFEHHRPKAIHLGINIVIASARNQTNVTHFSSHLYRIGTSLNFEIFDDGDGIAIHQCVSDCILNERRPILAIFQWSICPFVSTLGAD